MPRPELLPEPVNQPKSEIFEDFIIERRDSLYREKRGDKALILDTDSGSWAILPEYYDSLLNQAAESLSFSDFCTFNPSHSPTFLKETLDNMYQHGFISINGKSYFPPPAIMWKPVDDAPVYPRSFYFHTTDACNFRCDYCYAKAAIEGKSLGVQTACAIIDKILKDIPYDYVFIEFHGGEPLLYKNRIFEIVEYGEIKARMAGKRIDFSMQTNGSLLDEEVTEFAKAHRMRVGVSIDGPSELHDRYRKDPKGMGTFEKVWHNVQEAERRGLHCGFIGVIHEPADYLKAFEFFVSRGIMSFKLNYSAAIGRASESLEFAEERGHEMCRGYLDMIDVATQFNRKSPVRLKVPDVNFYIAALVTKKREYMCLRSPCGVGRSILAFGTEGEIYPCEEMSTYPEFMCGDIWSPMPLTELIDSSPAILKLRSRRVESIPACRDCPWRRFCAGKCLHKAYHFYGEINREDPMCSFYKALFPELIWRIHEDPAVLNLM